MPFLEPESSPDRFLLSPITAFLPLRVQRFVTLLPIKMHNVLKDWIESMEIQCSSMLSLYPSLI